MLDVEASSASPTLGRRVLAVGTELRLHGYRRAIDVRELGWLHAAITSALGRPHDMRRGTRSQAWSVRPWECSSGCAVIWWDEADGAAMARRRHRARIGRVQVELECGPQVRIHSPPQRAPGVYPVRITTLSPVVIARTLTRGEHVGTRQHHTRPTAECITSALWTIARKLGVDATSPPPLVHVFADRTKPRHMLVRGKVGRLSGWAGQVDLLCSPTARWLLECAARGLGLGARGAYGMGAIAVTDLHHRDSAR